LIRRAGFDFGKEPNRTQMARKRRLGHSGMQFRQEVQ
jgi:hypothetical protein